MGACTVEFSPGGAEDRKAPTHSHYILPLAFGALQVPLRRNDDYEPAATAFSICGLRMDSKFSGVIGPTSL
jgi:hypothetical protein